MKPLEVRDPRLPGECVGIKFNSDRRQSNVFYCKHVRNDLGLAKHAVTFVCDLLLMAMNGAVGWTESARVAGKTLDA